MGGLLGGGGKKGILPPPPPQLLGACTPPPTSSYAYGISRTVSDNIQNGWPNMILYNVNSLILLISLQDVGGRYRDIRKASEI